MGGAEDPGQLGQGGGGELAVHIADAGLVTGRRIDQRHYRIRLNDPTTVRLHETMEVEGKAYPLAYVELGDPGLPHAVVPFPGLAQADPQALFPKIHRAVSFHE